MKASGSIIKDLFFKKKKSHTGKPRRTLSSGLSHSTTASSSPSPPGRVAHLLYPPPPPSSPHSGLGCIILLLIFSEEKRGYICGATHCLQWQPVRYFLPVRCLVSLMRRGNGKEKNIYLYTHIYIKWFFFLI